MAMNKDVALAWLFGAIGGMSLAVLVATSHAQSPDPFVSAVNEKQAEMARSAGVFGDQLIRDHQVINDQAKQINDLTKQVAELKAHVQTLEPGGSKGTVAEPEKK